MSQTAAVGVSPPSVYEIVDGGRLDIYDDSILAELSLGCFTLTHLSSVSLPQLATAHLANLRHLSIKVDRSCQNGDTLPSLAALEELELCFTGRSRLPSYSPAPKLVDFRRFPRLASLLLNGDTWSGLADQFMGRSESLSVCVLRGPLVLSSTLDQFFGLIDTCLQCLFCYGTHLVGELKTQFVRLRHLSLHKVVVGRSFPFLRCPSLTSLALEADDVDDATRVVDLNDLLQRALLSTATSLRFLTLRSGYFWLLSPATVHALLRTIELQGIFLDGAIALDGRDWLLVSALSNLKLVGRADSWIPLTVSF